MRSTSWITYPAASSGWSLYWTWQTNAYGGYWSSARHYTYLPTSDSSYLLYAGCIAEIRDVQADLAYTWYNWPPQFPSDAKAYVPTGYSIGKESFHVGVPPNDIWVDYGTMIPPDTSFQMDVWPYGYDQYYLATGGRLGKWSSDRVWHLSMPWTWYMAYGMSQTSTRMRFMSKADMIYELERAVGNPPVDSEGSFSYPQFEIFDPLPKSVTLYFICNSFHDSTTHYLITDQSAAITAYIQWIPKGGSSAGRDYDGAPGSGWVEAGSAFITYNSEGTSTPLELDLTSLGSIDISGYSDTDVYEIAIALIRTDDPTWIDPTPQVDETITYDDRFSWTDIATVSHYDEGQFRYRWIGPEIPLGGSPNTESVTFGEWNHGILSGQYPQRAGVVAETPPRVVSPTVGYMQYTPLRAVTRPKGRVDGDITLLYQDYYGGSNFVLRSHIARDGSYTVSAPVTIPDDVWLNRDRVDVLNYAYIGGNETSRILFGEYVGGQFSAGLLDTSNMVRAHVSGFDMAPPNGAGGSTQASGIAAYTSGRTYLVGEPIYDSVNKCALPRYQRWSVSLSGTAQRVGPLLTPNMPPTTAPGYYLLHGARGDVWDEDGVVAVFYVLRKNEDYVQSLNIAVWDGTTSDPQCQATLCSWPYNYSGYDPSTYDRIFATFYRTATGYEITYLRPVLHPLSARDALWGSWVRRRIVPETGYLGPEILIADTRPYSSYATHAVFHRMDNGIGAVLLTNEIQRHTGIYGSVSSVYEHQLRVVLGGGVEEGSQPLGIYNNEGNVQFWLGAYTFGATIPGRLYFKYREP